ncbi:MAG: hypothetical protein PUF60_10800 [Firmicutes bacterium]|nr:hypothetical protein [Bacillota bacterium]
MISKAVKLNNIITAVENNLKNTIRHYIFDNKNRFFILEDKSVIRVTGFTISGDDVIVAEYAGSLEEAYKNMMEDGDLYYISEMTAEEISIQILAEASELK